MFTSTFESPFPVSYMNRFYTGKDPARTWGQKSNNWAGRNFMKWKNDEYDKLFDQVLVELNAEKAATMWQQLNDIVINDYADIPLVDRKSTSSKAKSALRAGPARVRQRDLEHRGVEEGVDDETEVRRGAVRGTGPPLSLSGPVFRIMPGSSERTLA